MVSITGNFTVNGTPFGVWFEQVRLKNSALFPYSLNTQNFEAVMKELKKLMCKSTISMVEFVGIFAFIYNETGGTFRSMKELGGAGHYAAHGYGERNAGRGLIQLTSDSVYRVALKQLGYDYDSMTSAQLDALFLQKEVYLRAVCVYISHPHLAGNHWQKVQAGEFYQFGVAISGGAGWYGTLYANRCNTLLKPLQGASIKNVGVASATRFAWVALLVLVFVGLLLYVLYRYGSLKLPSKNVRQKNITPLPDSPDMGNNSNVLATV